MEPYLQNQWLWMIVLIPLSLILSYYIYAKHKFPNFWTKPLLVFLRASALSLLVILLFNPQIKQKTVRIVYPELSILLDQSTSIQDSVLIQNFYDQWRADKLLNEKFHVNWYGFGLEVNPLKKLEFKATQTNIGRAVENLDRILGQDQGPLVVVTDGQQTLGPSYEYYRAQNRQIYPVVVGDTIWPEDLALQRVTANPIVRKDQAFEVELVLNRTGSVMELTTELEAYQEGKKIKSIPVNFPYGATKQLLKTDLVARKVGPQSFRWVLKSVPGERIFMNNNAVLSVEGVDEQRRILLVYHNMHPDIGALTRGLEADERTEIISAHPEKALDQLKDIDAVILYQPNRAFAPLMAKIIEEQINVWLISGPQTDWSEVSKIQPVLQKEFLGVSDELFSLVNREFSLFQPPYEKWSQMPPLVSDIGPLSINTPHEALLTSVLQNQPSKSIQLGFFEQKGMRWIVWDGIGLWRWKMEAFRQTKSHESFDAFLGILGKYITKHQEKSVLKVKFNSVYAQSAQAELYAQYLDKTDELDMSADLEIKLIHQESKREIIRPLLADSKQYKLNLSDLAPGIYNFTVRVLGTTEQKSGQFEIDPIQREMGQGFAKIQLMKSWAELNQAPLYYLSKMEDLRKKLLTEPKFMPREIVTEKKLDFIRWYYALAFLILMSTVEWFIRKYNGLT